MNGSSDEVHLIAIDLFARLLELELADMTDQRDEAIETLYWARKNHKLEIAEVKSTHSMSSVCRELRQELADARKLFESSKRARQSLSDACDHLQRELTEACEQLDRLAEAGKLALDVFINQGWDDDLIAAQKLKEALATVKGGRP